MSMHHLQRFCTIRAAKLGCQANARMLAGSTLPSECCMLTFLQQAGNTVKTLDALISPRQHVFPASPSQDAGEAKITSIGRGSSLCLVSLHSGTAQLQQLGCCRGLWQRRLS